MYYIFKKNGFNNTNETYKTHINPQITEVLDLNFQSLEVVSRYRETQLQVTKNYLCYM